MTWSVEVLGVSHPVSVSGTRDERIAVIAGLQRGRASRDQLVAVGISSGAVHRRRSRGALIRQHRGVYAVGHAAPEPLAAETAALLACGPGAVLSHDTAARMWKILRYPDRRAAAPVHLTTPGRHGAAPEGVVRHRSSTLGPTDIRTLERLPVTSPARTLLDLSDTAQAPDLEWSVDEAIQLRLVSAAAIADLARGATGRRGAARLARAAARHADSGITRSEAEKLLRRLVRAAGLPEPRFNFRLHGYNLDAYWPDHGLVVEVDSYQWHSIRPKMERDTSKGAALVAAGLQVMRFTAVQLEHRPLVVTSRLAQALARAEGRGGA